MNSLLARRPSPSFAGCRRLAHAARNNDTVAARLMLTAGLPVDTFSQHRGTPLHWAAWHGNTELLRLLLSRGVEVNSTDNDYKSSPLGWAIHASEYGWHPDQGDYAGVVEALLKACAVPPAKPQGSDAVRAVLRSLEF